MIVDALQAVGAARSIVIDEGNVVLAGNGVLEAAGEAGITRLRVVEADGQEIIAVRRTGLSAAQKRHLAIADNRSAELAQWNSAQFADDLGSGKEFDKFFTENELSLILRAAEDPDNTREHWKGMPEFEQPDAMPFRRLVVNFKNQSAVDAFARLIEQTVSNRTTFVWYPVEPRAKATEVYAEADA